MIEEKIKIEWSFEYFKKLILRSVFRIKKVDEFPSDVIKIWDAPGCKLLITIKILWKRYKFGIK